MTINHDFLSKSEVEEDFIYFPFSNKKKNSITKNTATVSSVSDKVEKSENPVNSIGNDHIFNNSKKKVRQKESKMSLRYGPDQSMLSFVSKLR